MKKGKKFVSGLLLLFFSSTIIAQEPDGLIKIKSIKPLVSTQKDVIVIFGEPLEKEKINYGKHYELPDGRISIIYATGLCVTKTEDGIKKVYGWNVPEWTVIDLTFTPKKRISPEKLNVNFDGFEKEEVGDVPGAVVYHNDELGMYYGIYKGKIETILFYPANQYDYLYCK